MPSRMRPQPRQLNTRRRNKAIILNFRGRGKAICRGLFVFLRTVTAEFFASLEKDTAEGKYFKLETTGERVQDCTALAWKQVWRLSTEGKLKRAFATDIESSVPKEYTKDGKAHCYLYISVWQE